VTAAVSEIGEIPNEIKILHDDLERVTNAFNQLNRFQNEHIHLSDIEYFLKKAKNLVESIKTFQGWFEYWQKRNWKDEGDSECSKCRKSVSKTTYVGKTSKGENVWLCVKCLKLFNEGLKKREIFDWNGENWICPKCNGIAKESNHRSYATENTYCDITCTICGFEKKDVCIFEEEN